MVEHYWVFRMLEMQIGRISFINSGFGAPQEPAFDQLPQHANTGRPIESPQTLCLSQREAQSRHFQVLRLHHLDQVSNIDLVECAEVPGINCVRSHTIATVQAPFQRICEKQADFAPLSALWQDCV
jgi:hypothetical protein